MHAATTSHSSPLGISEDALEETGALWTAREIAQQPQMLRETHAMLEARRTEIASFIEPLLKKTGARVILTGAGTSAFIGECLQPLLARRGSACVEAIPTTDIVSAPSLYLCPDRPTLLVSFGRSGNSPESIAAVELAESHVRDVRHLVITCNPQGSLASPKVKHALSLLLPEATHDRSFAMTSSFSCMMYAASGALGGIEHRLPRVDAIADATANTLRSHIGAMRDLARLGFSRVVYLGSHIFKGLARESALKLGELTNGGVATCFDSPMGFRHGPKTFVNDNTLAIVFVSNDPLTRRYDLDLINELRADGCARRVIAVTTSDDDLPPGDRIIVPGMRTAEDAELLWPYISLAQLYAFFASQYRGMSPDNPNPQGTVNRVVQGVRLHTLEA